MVITESCFLISYFKLMLTPYVKQFCTEIGIRTSRTGLYKVCFRCDLIECLRACVCM